MSILLNQANPTEMAVVSVSNLSTYLYSFWERCWLRLDCFSVLNCWHQLLVLLLVLEKKTCKRVNMSQWTCVKLTMYNFILIPRVKYHVIWKNSAFIRYSFNREYESIWIFRVFFFYLYIDISNTDIDRSTQKTTMKTCYQLVQIYIRDWKVGFWLQ